MDWLLDIFRKPDPYERGLSSQWTQFVAPKKIFTAETACGYKVSYTLECHYQKVNHQEFKSAQMLEEHGENKFLDALNREVVLPALRANKRFLRLFTDQFPFPTLCHVVKEADGPYIARDISCIKLNRELKATGFKHSGSLLTHISIQLSDQTEDLLEENYMQMIKLYGLDSIKNTPEYAAREEAILIATAKAGLELRDLFRQKQTDQVLKGKRFTITTHLVGRALEVIWKFEKSLYGDTFMRGYRKDGGFSAEISPLEINGACIADSRANSSTVLTLTAGTDHFFTFVIAQPDKGKPVVLESLRFSVRVPTGEEVAHADRLILALQNRGNQKSTLSKKTSDAVKELMSFVEFDENVSALEKQLIERISSKEDYSPEEKANKIERLRAVVESLHMGA